jgi:O-acetyl-ADP-ribose deacetylase (regulator of RNase III)
MKTKIEIYLGDITDLEVDAIVNAADNHLGMGGGVALAIKKRGGKIIEDEAVEQGPISIGDAIITTAGKLKSKYVIHAAAMGLDFRTDANKIKNAVINSLKRADELRIKSIAFPAIGTGIGHFPAKGAAEIMIDVVKKHVAGQTNLDKIIFALFNRNTYNAFKEALDK